MISCRSCLLALLILPTLPLLSENAALPKADAAGATEESELPPIAKVAKGAEALTKNDDGQAFFTIWVDKKKHRVLAEIPSSHLKKPFLLATSITGGSMTGWQWEDRMLYWERYDQRLALVEPEIQHRAAKGSIKDVVKRTYRDSIFTTLPIIATGSNSSMVVDLTALLAQRASLFVGALSSGSDSSLARVSKAKVFPDNVEIEIDLPGSASSGFSMFGSGGGSGLSVHYSISRLPSTGYSPRKADDRIGYFLTAHKDFNADVKDDTTFVRYINRWQLEKADSTLKLSPPANPIIFYIEKTVPVRYRRYVREGILEWNKAFEKIGILDAIVVRQQTETEFNKLDPENVNYNFFRWITSESAFAMGPSRVHPETGQILDADIIFDESMIRFWFDEYADLIKKGPVTELHPALHDYIDSQPHRHPMRRWRGKPQDKGNATTSRHTDSRSHQQLASGDLPRLVAENNEARLARQNHKEALDARRGSLCDYGHGKRHQLTFGLFVLRTMLESAENEDEEKDDEKDKDKVNNEFLGEVLKEVVMHEVGHTLGLRHNFKASSWLPLEKINEDGMTAISASVMDYNPTNISPKGAKQGVWATRTLGPYDYWAIEFGYTLEDSELPKIAARSGEDGLAYATDEDVVANADPYVYRFDMGKDPLDYARQRMDLVQQTLLKLRQQVKKGDSYSKVRQGFDMLVYDFARSSWRAAKFIGGHHVNRYHKGDAEGRAPIKPVDAKTQREAMDLVCDRVLSKDALKFSPDLLNYLAPGRWYHWGTSSSDDAEYPIHDRILQVQLWSLFDFINPRVLTLIVDTAARVPAGQDVLTIPEVFKKLSATIWTELKDEEIGKPTNAAPFISNARRNLQHAYVDEMINLALEGDFGMSPQIARTQAAHELRMIARAIKEFADKNTNSQIDDYTRAHLEETKLRIVKALDAPFSRD